MTTPPTDLLLPSPPPERLVGFLGALGSGKTEVSVNYSLLLRSLGLPVQIVDLDIVNPYFRCREAVEPLTERGVEVVIPEGGHFWADLPIVLPRIKGVITGSQALAVLDVGGDDMGARLLSHFTDLFEGRTYQMYLVLNANRPFTDSVEGCLRVIESIETASRLRITGIVENTHLVDQTDPETVLAGHELSLKVAERTGLPIVFLSVLDSIAEELPLADLGVPVLRLSRLLLKPWETGFKPARPVGIPPVVKV